MAVGKGTKRVVRLENTLVDVMAVRKVGKWVD